MPRPLIHPVILSGGSGTRLWPLSRAVYPKQLMALSGERSLLQETATRVADPERFAPPIIVCNLEHRFLVAEQLRSAGTPPQRILLEPLGRNTAPAACVAALLLAEAEPDALLFLLPSDHYIAKREAFLGATETAAAAAAAGWLVTFGIKPEGPETGYGYIRRGERLDALPGCHRIARFVEKPDRRTAEGYLESGAYAWNSGMFLLPAGVLLDEIERYQPDVLSACKKAVAQAEQDMDFLRLDETAFAASPSISLDYAVMERTEHAAMVPAEIGWSDVGSWNSLWEISERDERGNSLRGDVIAVDCSDNYLRSESGLLAAIGVENMIVVATADSLLVCPRDRAQDIRKLVDELAAAGRREHIEHQQVYRPWGSFQSVDAGEGFQVKRLIINPGASISLQRHRKRAEHWVVVRGTAEVTRDEDVFTLTQNQSTYIPLGATHRLRNPGDEPLHIIEVQSGAYLGEDDIERFEDLYGRE